MGKNFGRNKRKIEAAKKAKREEKQSKRLSKKRAASDLVQLDAAQNDPT